MNSSRDDVATTDLDRLIVELRSGSEQAGAFLVSQLAPMLLGYARLLAVDLSETDRELLCERAVERAVDRIDRYSADKGTFPGWVRGILRNEVRTWRRSMPQSVDFDEDFPLPRDNEETAESSGASQDAVTVVEQLLDALAPTDALIIRLHDIEQLTFKAIAAQLDVREDACRQRHHRALARLRKLSQPGRGEGGTDD
ncbi:MAG TPA: sigma-70 family RNA polymerase sigma factor [Candidatus Micrarchaeaceae archaeon]|nr:sigma-70 family RNA polymerase sigma factor [Candidatus Micrarchaeaceae archaeon]